METKNNGLPPPHITPQNIEIGLIQCKDCNTFPLPFDISRPILAHKPRYNPCATRTNRVVGG